jgi:hypothetical protein
LPAWVDHSFFYLPFNLSPLLSTDETILGGTIIQGPTVGFGAEPTCVELTPGKQDNGVQFVLDANATSVQFATHYLLPNGTPITCYVSPEIPGANQTTKSIGPLPHSPSALEVVQQMTAGTNPNDIEFCSSRLVLGWVRDTFSLTNANPDTNTTSERLLDFTFLSCTYNMRIASFNVSVNTEGRVLSATQTSSFADPTNYFAANVNETNLIQEAITFLSSSGMAGFTDYAEVQNFRWHNDSFTSDWMNVLFTTSQCSNDLVDPLVPVPKAVNIAPLAQSTMQMLFALLLNLHPKLFAVPETPTLLTGTTVTFTSRLFVSYSLFLVVTAILSLHLVAATWYYTFRPKRFLPRMPTTIGSVMAFVSGSRALEDFAQAEKNTDNNENGQLYAYGRFLGTDGKTRVGIERHRYVIPLETRNPEVKRRRWNWKGNKMEPRTWI